MKEERIRSMDNKTLKDIASSWDGTSDKFIWEDEILHEDDAHMAEAELSKRHADLRDMQ